MKDDKWGCKLSDDGLHFLFIMLGLKIKACGKYRVQADSI